MTEQCTYTIQGEYTCSRNPSRSGREEFFTSAITSIAECNAFCASNGGNGQYGQNNSCKCVQKAKNLPATCKNFQCNKGRDCKFLDSEKTTTNTNRTNISSAKVANLLR